MPVTWLPLMVVFRIVSGLSPTSMAESKAIGSPSGSVAVAELPVSAVFVDGGRDAVADVNATRVRVHVDHPPPRTPGSCWSG